jgi:hypothetical protein
MQIKHSKYKNTGLIFELLVRQIASDTLGKKDSPALLILKKHFAGKTSLTREFKLYEYILKNRGVSHTKAESIISTIIEVSRKLDAEKLKKQKYELIKEIKNHYNVEEFFSIKVRDYKPLAAMYCLLEAHTSEEMVDPSSIVDNKVTLFEHLTNTETNRDQQRDSLVEEYSKYDKDLKLLVYKILLEKFNNKYDNLLPEQKQILRDFITSVDSTVKLKTKVNEELTKVKQNLEILIPKVGDEVIKIKLQEIYKRISPVDSKSQVKDRDIVDLMQYYQLVSELNTI